MRRFSGPVLFVLFSVAIFVLGVAIGANNQPSGTQAQGETDNGGNAGKPWLTKDAAGFFTAWLALVGTFQAGLFIWQLWLIRQSLIDAKKAADAAKEAALAARTQASAASVTARAAQKSAEVAEQSLTKISRPYMYVLNIGNFIDPRSGDPFVLPMSIANYGETPAEIDNFHAGFSITNTGLPEGPPSVPIGNAVYGPRERIDNMRFDLTENLNFVRATDGTLMPHLPAGSNLYFRIMIYYHGPFSEGHESSFCWQWSDKNSAMLRWGGSDYNYVG